MMTDKELKDWCKTCSVEPPAMRLKCPECEHNPDKEPTNDSLKKSDKNFNENCTHEKEQITCDCKYCMENPTCYKELLEEQLARKTQECERMKYYLSKIRQDELSRLDVEWDEYITECTSTDYSNIITYVEYALGERKDD